MHSATVWWQALSGTQQVLWGIGVFSTTILLFQLVASLLGFEHHSEIGHDSDTGDHSADHDHVSFLQFFTLRNLVAFLTGVGWGSLMLISWGFPNFVAIVGGICFGVAFVAVVMLLMMFFASLAVDGSIDLNNALNQQGEVTVAIPAYGSGFGKMLLSIQGRLIEIEAYAAGASIARGTRVRVIRREGSSMLFVEPMVN
jgi:hypothetical protein